VPAVFAESRAYFLLPVQPDHQAQCFLDRFLLGRKATRALRFTQERVIDVDIRAHLPIGTKPRQTNRPARTQI
jgi:hypothetical protein